jgi:hypothetical protein
MMHGLTHRAELWGNGAYSSAVRAAPPVDLFAVARSRRVKLIGLELMVPRGVLVPVPGGFHILLRDLEPRELDIGAPEASGLLTHRQRFTLAHEIAHTLFYKNAKENPVDSGEVKKDSDLEEICDVAAKRVLVPAELLEREIRNKLDGDYRRIDAGFIRNMVSTFDVSYEVVIERFWAVDRELAAARCILLAQREGDEALIRTWHMGTSLLSAFAPLRKYQPVAKWFPEPLQPVSQRAEVGDWQVTRGTRTLQIQKFPLSRRGDFLLQLDDIENRAPDSNFPWEASRAR